jgi:pyruvate kinase
VNLPGCKVNLPTLTEKDIDDIVNFGVRYNVDLIAASFIRSADDVRQLRSLLGDSQIQIISKIEN